MITYATITDVRRELRSIQLSDTSLITPDSIEDKLIQESSYINLRLEKYYNIPIVGEHSLNHIRQVCVYLVVSRVFTILLVKETSPTKDLKNKKTSDKSSVYKNLAEVMLNKIEKGTVILTDALLKSNRPISYSYAGSLSRQRSEEVFDDVDC